MPLLVFLGNPGLEYKWTRHNIGRLFAEESPLANRVSWRQKFKGSYAKTNLQNISVMMLKPDTFMNRSGESVSLILQFYHMDPSDLLIVHDDLGLQFGEVSFKNGGGLSGHNGLRSIHQSLGTSDFSRFRFGISRPTRGDIASYVLGKFSDEERVLLPSILTKAEQLLIESLVSCSNNRTQLSESKHKLINPLWSS